MTFNRLKSLVNNDKSLLIRVLKTNKSQLIELNPNGDQIRRRVNKPLPQMDQQFEKSLDEKTVYLKGIPKDTTLDELMEWSRQLGPILEVRRVKAGKEFNGCAFVTFADKVSAEKVVNQSILKFKDVELSKEIKLKAKTDKKENSLVKGMEGISMDTTEETVDKSVIELEAAVLLLKDMPRKVVRNEKKNKTNRIKDFFSKYGKAVYVGTDASANCLIQFGEPLGAQKAFNAIKMSNGSVGREEVLKFEFEGHPITAQLLTGEEELNHWIKAKKRIEKKKRRQKRPNNKTKHHRKRSNSSQTLGLEPKRLAPAMA